MAAALLAGACSKKTGGGVKLKTDTDSVAYVIGMNVGMNLMKMDSTINVNAVCEGIRDVFRQGTRFSAADAEVFYLRYMNYALPEKARAYEEQFLQDILKANRNYARTASGVTYTVEVLGDQEQIPASDRDSIALRYLIRTADGQEVYSSYERGDTLRTTLGGLLKGMNWSAGAERSTRGFPPRRLTERRATKSWEFSRIPRCTTKSSLSMSINMRIGRGAAIYAVNFKPLFQIFYNFAQVNP